MEYTGEHLGFGKAGNILIVLSFTASLLSALAYGLGLTKKYNTDSSWKYLGRVSYGVHSVAVISIIGLLFFLIHGHFFEYYYVWQHSNSILPVKYMWACFWEGQEGSFLLWTFWNIVLSFFIIRINRSWEKPVMLVMMMIQVFLASMILGLEYGSIKIGSNPFILLRNQADFANLPFVKLPDYLSRIKDGRGLNPLLQNYWMVIHPPTLFLGFASTAVPFAFAMAGLITGQVKEWVRPAIPWAFFSVMILGTGILMGGAWAYEALSFGGFWAWDPVENASLVPWLTLVGGAHVLLIYKKNGHSLSSSFILIISTFILILYSTFLTRSGILGDTSVHAFTDLGMSGQLVIYMAFFIILSVVLMIINRKKIAGDKSEEENLASREFWMFMGMMVLVISAGQITVTTSIPVINKLFNTKMAPPADAIGFYNSWQIPLAAAIAILMAISQFFRWRNSDWKSVLKKLTVSFIVATIITIVIELYFHFDRFQYIILLFASLWAFLANLDYLTRIIKGKINHAGPSIAHMGIAFILLGALISNTEKAVISKNRLNVDLGKNFPNNENILLYQHDTLSMGDYYVTYKGKEKEGVNLFYEIEYFKPDLSTGKLLKQFSLKPIVQLNERMGNVSEPATHHFIDRDIYTHVTYAEMNDKDPDQEKTGFREPVIHDMSVGDTIITSNAIITLDSIVKLEDNSKYHLAVSDIAVEARLRVTDVNKKDYHISPLFIIRNNEIYTRDTLLEDLGTIFSFKRIQPESGKFQIAVAERVANRREFIIMKAIIFPQINILWTGSLLMIIGTALAVSKRFKRING